MKKPVKITLICVGAVLFALLLTVSITATIIGIYSSGLEINKKRPRNSRERFNFI